MRTTVSKAISVLLAVLFVLGALSACGGEKGSVFTAEDEIITYQKIDPGKTQVSVARIGNIPVEQLCNAFEVKNPDVQIIFVDITGGNGDYSPFYDWAQTRVLPDIIVSAAEFSVDDMAEKYLVNLSDHPVTRNFEQAALQRIATDSHIYWLPGPSDISAMIYNKTLFDKYGWEVPATFDEFVALCDRIRSDTGGEIEPWNPNAKYGNELTTAFEAMTYNELFSGVENRSWYNSVVGGGGTFSGHMEPYTEVLQTLIDHGILREEHFTFSATTRGKEFSEGKIAMINANIYEPSDTEYEYGFMPFPTTTGEIGYLCDRYSCYMGQSVKEHSEKEDDAIARFLEFFSSEEGQNAYIGNSLKVSNVKDVEFAGGAAMSSLQPAIDAGHMFGILDFTDSQAGYTAVSLHNIAIRMATEGVSGADCISAIDEGLSKPRDAVSEAEPPKVIATATEDFTMLETSFLMADMYREAASADIGLITHAEPYRGNLMLLFAGDINEKMVTVFKPRSFANKSTLVKLSMTGQQLIDALNNPVGNEKTADCIYAYSGLKCEVAPWNTLGSKYVSVRLADGSEPEPDKLYTVAVWDGTIAEEYITETLEAYDGTWEELMTAKLQADGTLTPAADGRIKLIWD